MVPNDLLYLRWHEVARASSPWQPSDMGRMPMPPGVRLVRAGGIW